MPGVQLMSFMAKVERIKSSLGLPPGMAALQAVGAACELMGNAMLNEAE